MFLQAAYILPGQGEAIPRGALRIAGDRIVEIGRGLAPQTGEVVHDLGRSILLPGLVNPHCHLDLSMTAAPLPSPPTFTEWVDAVTAFRRQMTAEALAQGVAQATAELLAGGTTTLGDYVGDLRMLAQLQTTPFTGRAFCELIANGPGAAAARQAALRAEIACVRPYTPGWEWGVTPHAAHTLDRETLQTLLLQHEGDPQGPLAIHCAESREEVELFTTHRGPLATRMVEYGYEYGPPVDSPVDYLRRHGGLPRRSLLIHANYLTAADMIAMKAADITVVHSPQSHAYFDHAPFPFERLCAAGIPVALGTDGHPCTARLNMLTELRLLRQKYPHAAPRDLLATATTVAAAALWLNDRGTLTVGMRGDCIAIPAPRQMPKDPYEAIFSAETATMVVIGGRLVRGKNYHGLQ
ncbi:MAG: amidohydrolase family protein [Deltaproteobacteria bacterium]|nr:amidohydrolase family protein [Deltaproteobacteria bacterium]